MEALLLGLLILLMLCEVMTLPLGPPEGSVRTRAGPSGADLEFAEGYLKRFYGYKPERQKRAADSSADQTTEFHRKVEEMQRFFGLQVSGELSGETVAVMRKPRCGLADVLPHAEPLVRKPRCGLSDAEPFGRTTRWKRRTLSYRISRYSPTIRASQTQRAFRAAWKIWAEVTPIRFHKRSRKDADIVISFHSGDHEDGSPFDGKGGILAHAFMPEFGLGGDVHFDVAEDWTFNATGYNLFAVAVHEFGHALGLPHSADPGAIMYPSYNFVPQADLQLSFRDVEDVQQIYGINPSFYSLSLKRPPPRTPNKCDQDLSFDAITELQQEIVFFKDRFMWRKHPQFDAIGITLITSLWSDGAPPSLDAAYQNVEKNNLLFFKGNQYWMIRGLKVMEGFPRNISDLGFPPRVRSVDAALHFHTARLTVFFTGRECWRYNEERMVMEQGSPTPIAQEWPGVPRPLDAAVSYEGFVYFFKGNVQYKYDPKLKYVVSTRPANDLMDCEEEATNDTVMKKRR